MRMRPYLRRRIHDIAIPPEAWGMAAEYDYSMTHDDENGYVARVREFPYISGVEETPDAAVATLRHALALAIASNMRRGVSIPHPHAIPA